MIASGSDPCIKRIYFPQSIGFNLRIEMRVAAWHARLALSLKNRRGGITIPAPFD
jgi:hypothetical protein